jgi:hypothetical protein
VLRDHKANVTFTRKPCRNCCLRIDADIRVDAVALASLDPLLPDYNKDVINRSRKDKKHFNNRRSRRDSLLPNFSWDRGGLFRHRLHHG